MSKIIIPTGQLPGQQEAFLRLRRAKLEYAKADHAMPDEIPPDCVDRETCEAASACVYKPGCSLRRAGLARALAAREQREAAAAVNELLAAGQPK